MNGEFLINWEDSLDEIIDVINKALKNEDTGIKLELDDNFHLDGKPWIDSQGNPQKYNIISCKIKKYCIPADHVSKGKSAPVKCKKCGHTFVSG